MNCFDNYIFMGNVH